MELMDMLKIASKKRNTLVISCLIGLAFGVAISYILPERWISSNTYLIENLSTESTQNYYNYDNYYANQVGISYANVFISLLESRDVKISTLISLKQQVTQKNIKAIDFNLKTKKLGPQVIQVSYEDFTEEDSERGLYTLTEVSKQIIQKSNTSSGTGITITPTHETPVTNMITYNPIVFGLGGTLIGVLTGLVVISTSTYFKKNANRN